MGLFDKLKNVFFEEEEVEVIEKEEPKEKIPVAKKIDVEVSKKEELKKEKMSDTMEFDKKEEEKNDRDFKFPIGFDDKDFEVERTMEIFSKTKEIDIPKKVEEISDEPPVEKVDKEIPNHQEERIYQESSIYEEKPKYQEKESYQDVKEPVMKKVENVSEHRLYEGREELTKPAFTPSPIISPIYGILNKNYKKEEIVTKSEKKISQVETKKDDLDLVREKAYGDLAKDISESIDGEEINKNEDNKKEKEDLLYDLSEDSSPAVKVVTVGDAEEYFNDLGLEYNVDYKVEKKESNKKDDDEVKTEKKTRVEKNNNIDKNEDEDDKNLFDLIDAMYKDEEND